MKQTRNRRVKMWWGGMDEDNEWILVDESNFDFDSDDEDDDFIPNHHKYKTLLGQYKILC